MKERRFDYSQLTIHYSHKRPEAGASAYIMNIPFSRQELQHWIPYRISAQDHSLCDWLFTRGKEFTEPFFNDTISAIKNYPENYGRYRAVSSLEMLTEWQDPEKTPVPTAIIFHVSRCGSTLLSQLLAMNSSHVVLSEVPFLDELLRLPLKYDTTVSQILPLFNAALGFYTSGSAVKDPAVFIKSDSWHLHFYDQLRSMFPKIPFIFLYRDPYEVMLSQQKKRGMQSVPGIIEPALFGFSPDKLKETDLDRYMSGVLETYFTKMLDIASKDENVLLVNYAEGMSRIIQKLYRFIDKPLEESMMQNIERRIQYHGKYPEELFSEVRPPQVIPDFLSIVNKQYLELDELRRKRNKE